MPPAYVIAETKVEDPARYDDYRRLAVPSIEKHGGIYIVRGGSVESLVGDWNPERLAVVRFDSVERAKEWWNSPEYSEARQLRSTITRSRIIVAEGV
jgi:uncharacterized protein (DUF1330 family)